MWASLNLRSNSVVAMNLNVFQSSLSSRYMREYDTLF